MLIYRLTDLQQAKLSFVGIQWAVLVGLMLSRHNEHLLLNILL
jgi:hypothetical protein